MRNFNQHMKSHVSLVSRGDHPDRVMLTRGRNSILGKTSRERTIDGHGDRSA
jgi:hypothetical protein